MSFPPPPPPPFGGRGSRKIDDYLHSSKPRRTETDHMGLPMNPPEQPMASDRHENQLTRAVCPPPQLLVSKPSSAPFSQDSLAPPPVKSSYPSPPIMDFDAPSLNPPSLFSPSTPMPLPSFSKGMELAPPSLHSSDPYPISTGLVPPMFQQPKSLSGMGITPPPLLSGSDFKSSDIPALSVGGRWVLPEGSVKPIPPCYPLERSSTLVQNSSSVEIACRISECLQRRSIAASYDTKKAKAKCMSANGVDFRIRLYSGKGKFSNGVIVEVQRRSGSSVSFQRDCAAILDSAGSGLNSSVESSSHDAPTLLPRTEQHVSTAQHMAGTSSISRAESLLTSNRLDANVLGLKSLCLMTNALQSGSETALNCSRVILSDVNGTRIRDVIISLVLHNKMPSVREFDGAIRGYLDTLRNFSMTVIANAVDILAKENELGSVLTYQSWLVDDYMDVLIEDLKQAENRPNEASTAARCLGNVVKASPEARTKAMQLGAAKLMGMALDVGRASHDNLAKETRKCVAVLQCR